MSAVPRLKLVHQLAWLLLGAVSMALLAVGAVVAWNLRSGFEDYLNARDDVQLDRFVQLVTQRTQVDPSLAWLQGRPAMQALIEEFARTEGVAMRPGRPDGPDGPARPPRGPRPPPPREDRTNGLDHPPPPRQQDSGFIGPRLQIFDAQGGWVAGRAQDIGVPTVSRGINVAGRLVATVRLTRVRAPEGVDARFLRSQYGGLMGAMGLCLALAVALAWWVARRWVRPLQALQDATRRVAAGDLGFQMAALGPNEGSHEIAALIDDVNAMSQALSKLETARRIALAAVSHELRTPLAVLRGELESIEDGAREPTPQVMANLREEVLQLTRLVNDLHTVSLADVGELPCDMRPSDANAVLQRVAQRFEGRAKQRGLRLSVLPPSNTAADVSNTPLMVRWDAGRIEQLVTNLLENSLRYTATPGLVVIAWGVQGAELVLTVEDSAPGVRPSQLSQLFEPLFRADASRQRGSKVRARTSEGETGGSGLGLSIAQAIVRAHRGQISATASPLGGLTVQVRLPREGTA
jgi:two-component system sensor histidine kinase BaeS